MKNKQKNLSRQLRYSGYSVGQISKRVNCSKSSVSRWVQDIVLTPQQIEQLRSNQDKGRAKAANHPNSPKQFWNNIRRTIIDSSKREIPQRYSYELLKIVGSTFFYKQGE